MIQMRDALAAAITDAIRGGIERGELNNLTAPPLVVELERPRAEEHGDWSSNIALAVSGEAAMKPREVAETIVRHLVRPRGIADVAVEGAGFINFHIEPRAWGEVVRRVNEAGHSYGHCDLGAGWKINLEFVSANPTGPMHLGHVRWAAWGDALGRVMQAAGYEVVREFYINDAGNQLALLGASLAARYLEECGVAADLPDDGYQGHYLVELARELKAETNGAWVSLGGDELERRCGVWGCERMLAHIASQLERLGVTFDVWFSERAMRERGEVEDALADLRKGGYVFDDDGATWLRTSGFGDEKDRVLIKSDGSYTYLSGDIAYHRDKHERGFDLAINLWGADHAGHVPRLRAACQMLGHSPDELEVILGQLVSVTRGGEPVRMSKRAGEVYTFDDLVDEIGHDAARFHFLMQGPDTALSLDVEAAVRQSMENPVYYVQYAHARIRSIQRIAAADGISAGPLRSADLSLLVAPEELALLRKLDEYPDLIEESAARRAPQRLTQWARELAAAFHRFYSEHRVLQAEPAIVGPRLWLVEACRIALASCLDMLSVSAPEEMLRLDDGDTGDGPDGDTGDGAS